MIISEGRKGVVSPLFGLGQVKGHRDLFIEVEAGLKTQSVGEDVKDGFFRVKTGRG